MPKRANICFSPCMTSDPCWSPTSNHRVLPWGMYAFFLLPCNNSSMVMSFRFMSFHRAALSTACPGRVHKLFPENNKSCLTNTAIYSDKKKNQEEVVFLDWSWTPGQVLVRSGQPLDRTWSGLDSHWTSIDSYFPTKMKHVGPGCFRMDSASFWMDTPKKCFEKMRKHVYIKFDLPGMNLKVSSKHFYSPYCNM